MWWLMYCRYIVRYKSEEERLAHQLDQTQTKLRMAIEQGQKLRAKTNRYEDELKRYKGGNSDLAINSRIVFSSVAYMN